jgi:hypothetical protein
VAVKSRLRGSLVYSREGEDEYVIDQGTTIDEEHLKIDFSGEIIRVAT